MPGKGQSAARKSGGSGKARKFRGVFGRLLKGHGKTDKAGTPRRVVGGRETTVRRRSGNVGGPTATRVSSAGSNSQGPLDRLVSAVIDGSPVARSAGRGTETTKTGPKDYSGVRCLLNPVWCYYGFILSVVVITLFGLMMVFSSSAVDLVANDDSPWDEVIQQTAFALVGMVLAFLLSKVPVAMFRQLSPWLMVAALVVQLCTLIPGIGSSAGGNTGWIVLGPLRFQPAEILKWCICMWLPFAMQLTRKSKAQGIRVYTVPLASFLAAFIAVMVGHDLGTGMIIVLIGAVALLVGGFPLRWFFGCGVAGAIAVVLLFVSGSSNRLSRIFATYGQCSGDDLEGVCYQSIHGMYAMASGGLAGVGLGNSREKWNYLPAAHNDFIFAVIGEELGFLGAAAVILCFVVMGWCLVNIAVRHQDSYARMVLMCIVTWLVGQALVNIAVVIGLLPVMGLPMPFVSSGGTSLVMCLAAAGTAVAMVRSQREVSAALVKA